MEMLLYLFLSVFLIGWNLLAFIGLVALVYNIYRKKSTSDLAVSDSSKNTVGESVATNILGASFIVKTEIPNIEPTNSFLIKNRKPTKEEIKASGKLETQFKSSSLVKAEIKNQGAKLFLIACGVFIVGLLSTFLFFNWIYLTDLLKFSMLFMLSLILSVAAYHMLRVHELRKIGELFTVFGMISISITALLSWPLFISTISIADIISRPIYEVSLYSALTVLFLAAARYVNRGAVALLAQTMLMILFYTFASAITSDLFFIVLILSLYNFTFYGIEQILGSGSLSVIRNVSRGYNVVLSLLGGFLIFSQLFNAGQQLLSPLSLFFAFAIIGSSLIYYLFDYSRYRHTNFAKIGLLTMTLYIPIALLALTRGVLSPADTSAVTILVSLSLLVGTVVMLSLYMLSKSNRDRLLAAPYSLLNFGFRLFQLYNLVISGILIIVMFNSERLGINYYEVRPALFFAGVGVVALATASILEFSSKNRYSSLLAYLFVALLGLLRIALPALDLLYFGVICLIAFVVYFTLYMSLRQEKIHFRFIGEYIDAGTITPVLALTGLATFFAPVIVGETVVGLAFTFIAQLVLLVAMTAYSYRFNNFFMRIGAVFMQFYSLIALLNLLGLGAYFAYFVPLIAVQLLLEYDYNFAKGEKFHPSLVGVALSVGYSATMLWENELARLFIFFGITIYLLFVLVRYRSYLAAPIFYISMVFTLLNSYIYIGGKASWSLFLVAILALLFTIFNKYIRSESAALRAVQKSLRLCAVFSSALVTWALFAALGISSMANFAALVVSATIFFLSSDMDKRYALLGGAPLLVALWNYAAILNLSLDLYILPLAVYILAIAAYARAHRKDYAKPIELFGFLAFVLPLVGQSALLGGFLGSVYGAAAIVVGSIIFAYGRDRKRRDLLSLGGGAILAQVLVWLYVNVTAYLNSAMIWLFIAAVAILLFVFAFGVIKEEGERLKS